MAHMQHNPKVFFTVDEIEDYEHKIRMQKRIERYSLARRFAWGNVLDVACGVGYGSYLISKNPDVKSVTGADYNEDAIEWAKKEFASDNVHFLKASIQEIETSFNFLISLETIEHLENPWDIAALMNRCAIDEGILSFPLRKTTHYNGYHLWDLSESDIEHIFSEFEILESWPELDSRFVRLMRSKKKASSKTWLRSFPPKS